MISIKFICREVASSCTLASALGEHEGYQFTYCNSLDSLKLDEFDVFVSPANSFGELKGGIDMFYYRTFGGDKLQATVYGIIQSLHAGEVGVGEYAIVPLESKQTLLMCPTMTVPGDVSQSRNAYFFTRAMIRGLRKLTAAATDKPLRVLCPIPCIGVGMMKPKIAALQIETAFAAFEGRGLIHAVYMKADSDEYKKYVEYQVDNVAQNSKMLMVQMVKGR